MTDPRKTPDPSLVTSQTPARICAPVVDLTRRPGGARDRQLVYGDPITLLNQTDGHALVRSMKDGYCGTIDATAVGPETPATHRVTARATQAYSDPNFKSPDRATLSFGSTLSALSETPTFIETALGFVPRQHVHPVDTQATDPVAIAEIFLGTPYLWGGNSFLGIDCSGLVQAACLSCGIACPGDSDQQADQLGQVLSDETPLQRNDVIFWKGHVALVKDDKTLIHANAGHMAVVFEPIQEAIERIRDQGDGLPTARKRLVFPKD